MTKTFCIIFLSTLLLFFFILFIVKLSNKSTNKLSKNRNAKSYWPVKSPYPKPTTSQFSSLTLPSLKDSSTTIIENPPISSNVADTHVADTHVADTYVADTHVADTYVADTYVADTHVADTYVATPDTMRLTEQQSKQIPVYYMNLDISPDRKIYMEEQFRRYGITNYKRIPAVNGKNIDQNISDFSTNHLSTVDGLQFWNNYTNFTRKEELGCTLSHFKYN